TSRSPLLGRGRPSLGSPSRASHAVSWPSGSPPAISNSSLGPAQSTPDHEVVMFKKPDYIMITVSDMDRSLAFYRDVLGLALRFASPEWTEFETGTTTLALHGGGRPGKGP